MRGKRPLVNLVVFSIQNNSAYRNYHWRTFNFFLSFVIFLYRSRNTVVSFNIISKNNSFASDVYRWHHRRSTYTSLLKNGKWSRTSRWDALNHCAVPQEVRPWLLWSESYLRLSLLFVSETQLLFCRLIITKIHIWHTDVIHCLTGQVVRE